MSSYCVLIFADAYNFEAEMIITPLTTSKTDKKLTKNGKNGKMGSATG